MTLPALLYVVRHGQTDWNLAGRYQGHIDIPLNSRGEAQAVRNGMALATHLADQGLNPAMRDFVASPLHRARSTARLIRQACSLAGDRYLLEAAFREAAYGQWEGLTLAEARARHPEDFVRRRADRVHFAPEGGESFDTLGKRVRPALEELSSGSVVVCHGGVVKVIMGVYLGLKAREALSLDIRQDRVFRLRSGSLDYV